MILFNGVVQVFAGPDSHSPPQLAIREVNLSCYVFDAAELLWSLERLENDNAQREYYLTDCPGILLRAGREVRAHVISSLQG